MNKDIIKIINEWDPIDLFPLAPNNEYEAEAEKIIKFIDDKKNVSVGLLASTINTIFLNAFGSNIYNSKITECITVATKILALRK